MESCLQSRKKRGEARRARGPYNEKQHSNLELWNVSAGTRQRRIFSSKTGVRECAFNVAAAKAEPAKRANMVPVFPTERLNGFLFVGADGGCVRKPGS